MINAKYLGLTANQLAEMASKLEAENVKLRELLLDVADVLEEHTKLRELVERLRSAMSDGADNACDVFAENAKLRKLLLDAWNDAMQFDGFWDYVHDDGESANTRPERREYMREYWRKHHAKVVDA